MGETEGYEDLVVLRCLLKPQSYKSKVQFFVFLSFPQKFKEKTHISILRVDLRNVRKLELAEKKSCRTLGDIRIGQMGELVLSFFLFYVLFKVKKG